MESSIQPKPVRVFDREHPCTKVELFNCFWDPVRKDWRPRAVVEARGEIGDNAPKYLLKKGYARTFGRQFVDWYELSETGKDWLVKGLAAHLKRHPEDWDKLRDKRAVQLLLNAPQEVEVTRIQVRGARVTRTVSVEPVKSAKRLTRQR